jgi:hypothetical protein
MVRHFALALTLSAASMLGADKEKEPETTVPDSPLKADEREGLERGSWTAEGFASKGEAREVALPGHHDNKLLCVHFQGGSAGKTALKRLTGMSASADGKISLQMYSGEMHPPHVAIALCTGEKYAWQESEEQSLKSGWNSLSIDLGGKKWKSQATDWKHEAALADRTDVRAIIVLVYNGVSDGVLYVDGLRIDRDDQTTGVEAMIKRLGSEEFADREAAEKELSQKHSAMAGLEDVLATSKDLEVQSRAKRILRTLSGVGEASTAVKTRGSIGAEDVFKE